MALATGIDCPDILALDQMEAYGMDLEAIAGNGILTDLEPFLAESSLIHKEDFLENVLESRRYHGLLAGIPCDISLRTVAGNASDLGEESGWTLEEMTAYAAAHPDRKLFDGAVRQGILEDCLASGMDSFVDRLYCRLQGRAGDPGTVAQSAGGMGICGIPSGETGG